VDGAVDDKTGIARGLKKARRDLGRKGSRGQRAESREQSEKISVDPDEAQRNPGPVLALVQLPRIPLRFIRATSVWNLSSGRVRCADRSPGAPAVRHAQRALRDRVSQPSS